MRRLLGALLVAAVVLIPTGAAFADQAGFRSGGPDAVNRISPFAPGDTYCASQDLGVWFVLLSDTRAEMVEFRDSLDIEFILDGTTLDSSRAAVSPLVLGTEGSPTVWRSAIGDPSVGTLAVGTHSLGFIVYIYGVFEVEVEFDFDIADC